MATMKVCVGSESWIHDVAEVTKVTSFLPQEACDGSVLGAAEAALEQIGYGKNEVQELLRVVSIPGESYPGHTELHHLLRVKVRGEDRAQTWIVPTRSTFLMEAGTTVDRI